jgi:hypothetical protein
MYHELTLHFSHTHTYIPTPSLHTSDIDIHISHAFTSHIRHTLKYISRLHFTHQTYTHIYPTPLLHTSDMHTHLYHAFTSQIRHIHRYILHTSDMHTHLYHAFTSQIRNIHRYIPRLHFKHQTYTNIYPTNTLLTSNETHTYILEFT